MDKYTAEYQGFNARFTEYEKKRMVGFAAQFVALFKRNGLYLLRNSKTVQATIFNSFFMSVVFSTCFWDVARYDPEVPGNSEAKIR